jgi:hypothetical protein
MNSSNLVGGFIARRSHRAKSDIGMAVELIVQAQQL